MSCGWLSIMLHPVMAGAVQPRRSRHAEISTTVGGQLLMALGDSLQLRARNYRCVYDVCEVLATREPVHWLGASAMMPVSSRGIARSRRVGTYVVRAVVDGVVG